MPRPRDLNLRGPVQESGRGGRPRPVADAAHGEERGRGGALAEAVEFLRLPKDTVWTVVRTHLLSEIARQHARIIRLHIKRLVAMKILEREPASLGVPVNPKRRRAFGPNTYMIRVRYELAFGDDKTDRYLAGIETVDENLEPEED